MRKLIWIITFFPAFQAAACKCPEVHISYHIEKVVDVIVGKVIGESEEGFECHSPYYETASFRYLVKVDYSYKKNLVDIVEIYGGKGWGDCGAILYPGYNYQLAVFKCGNNYYTSMCADNNFLPCAGSTLQYLNNYFNVNYHPVSNEFVISTAFVSLIIIVLLSLFSVHNVYQYRSQRFRLRSVHLKFKVTTVSIPPV